MNRFRHAAAAALALLLAVSLCACGTPKDRYDGTPATNETVLQVYAPASAAGIISTAANAYKRYNPNLSIEINYDDGAMLASKIEAGYDCDVYIADSADYLDWLDSNCTADKNPNGNDCILEDSRTDVFIGPATVYDEDGNEKTEDVTYTAAVIKTGNYPNASKAFIEFLKDAAYDEADEAYETYGFTKIN